jgi:hypothetical protein
MSTLPIIKELYVLFVFNVYRNKKASWKRNPKDSAKEENKMCDFLLNPIS